MRFWQWNVELWICQNASQVYEENTPTDRKWNYVAGSQSYICCCASGWMLDRLRELELPSRGAEGLLRHLITWSLIVSEQGQAMNQAVAVLLRCRQTYVEIYLPIGMRVKVRGHQSYEVVLHNEIPDTSRGSISLVLAFVMFFGFFLPPQLNLLFSC